LGFAAGEGGCGLSEFDVAESDIEQGLEAGGGAGDI
jgi:hypothetical protein